MRGALPEVVREPETYPLLGRLQPSDRIVITGASGWMGRSLLHELEAALGDAITTQVLALGSRARTIRLGSGRPIDIEPWEHDVVAAWQPTTCIHLAYLTRDHAADRSLSDYIEGNLRLTAMAARLQQLPQLRAFVTTSSGAATTIDWNDATSAHQMYGFLKRLDEAFFAEEGERLGVPTVIARTWSVSGPYCTKPSQFALSDMIVQAVSMGHIIVRASGEVWRRYVDAGQYLALCMGFAMAGQTGIIDSTGELIEIRILASQIASQLDATLSAAPTNPETAPDNYYSSESVLEEVAAKVPARLLTLPEQVLITSAGLQECWGMA